MPSAPMYLLVIDAVTPSSGWEVGVGLQPGPNRNASSVVSAYVDV